MKISPLTKESIDFVIDNISENSLKEIKVFGKSLDDLREEFLRMTGEPWTSSFYDDQGECCAILALEPKGKAEWRVHFVFTKGGLNRIGFQITRFLRAISTNMVNLYDAKIEILSPLNDRKEFEWLESMGFGLVGEVDGINQYIKSR